MKGNWMKLVSILAAALFLLGGVFSFQVQAQEEVQDIERLGEFLYFDPNLSEPNGQSCADCHHPAKGFDDPHQNLPVSEGVIPGLYGGRNSPISAYAMYSPMFHFDEAEGLYVGGMFWDGRATGEGLGDPLADQAVGPFLNPVEMANEAKWQVVRDVANSNYSSLFQQTWSYSSADMMQFQKAQADTALIEQAYDQIGLSIAAFERTRLFGSFTSKYDAYLKGCIKKGGAPEDCALGIGPAAEKASDIFTKKEWRGLQLFMGENDNDGLLAPGEGAMCAACHVAEWTSPEDYTGKDGQPLKVQVPYWSPDGLVPPLFADHTYDNLGLPGNPKIAALIGEAQAVDLGLGFELEKAGILGFEEEYGKFRVVTLRNIGLSAPYGHNGFFKSLKDIIHFYNTRDLPQKGWPAPEYGDTINVDELGNLGLSPADEQALEAFLKTLSDGYDR